VRRGAWKDAWYVVPYDVPFRDIDYFGHVNNAIYLTYFEIARTELWFSITGGSEPADITFIVARAECDFRRPIHMERIDIAVRIAEMRNSSLDFVYEIRKSRGDELAATGKVTVVMFGWTTRSKIPIGDDLRRRVEQCSQHAS
jgi:acyl-CoA thioester hydrolase